MNIDLSTEATDFGSAALSALAAAGGDRLLESAEEKPADRASGIEPILAQLGAFDLDPRGGADELEAAASLCRSAGFWALPYPVAERLSRPADLDTDALIVVSEHHPSAAVAGLDLRMAAVTVAGRRFRATAMPSDEPPHTSAFVTRLELEPVDETTDADLALALVLPMWTLLGMLDRAMELTRSHILLREQFGRPLAQLQGVQFQLTDAEVERAGLEVLAKYALWSIDTGLDEMVDDALALRLAALEAADTVFRVAHQLHGATGFCDETTLSWLSRHSVPLRRLPLGLSATSDALTRRVGRRGLTGLYRGSSESADVREVVAP
ncbi:acyl-CoA dehydrogenase family protein [Gordonia sp. LSe1-13]|uniref:Acyl-CoA dehydrogenase family protein n=1 Tax=Gordonia sesuvii TaxID=3116777 RepID=A0ABU7M7G7_9ACTN|nr:acyl-CoA dehydrogenase family protein [Gordonia sp. LSe1-13]